MWGPQRCTQSNFEFWYGYIPFAEVGRGAGVQLVAIELAQLCCVVRAAAVRLSCLQSRIVVRLAIYVARLS